MAAVCGPFALYFLPERRAAIQRDTSRSGAFASAARTIAGCAERFEPDAGALHPSPTYSGSADLCDVFVGAWHHAHALRTGPGHAGRDAGIYSGYWAAGGSGDN